MRSWTQYICKYHIIVCKAFEHLRLFGTIGYSGKNLLQLLNNNNSPNVCPCALTTWVVILCPSDLGKGRVSLKGALLKKSLFINWSNFPNYSAVLCLWPLAAKDSRGGEVNKPYDQGLSCLGKDLTLLYSWPLDLYCDGDSSLIIWLHRKSPRWHTPRSICVDVSRKV